MLFADVDFTAPPASLRLEAQYRSHDSSVFCIEKYKQPEMLVSFNGNYTEHVNISH